MGCIFPIFSLSFTLISHLISVRVIKDKPGYFARKMQKAMKGLGTDDQALVRVIVSRCECDLVQIKNSFQQQFNGSLAEWIKVWLKNVWLYVCVWLYMCGYICVSVTWCR